MPGTKIYSIKIFNRLVQQMIILRMTRNCGQLCLQACINLSHLESTRYRLLNQIELPCNYTGLKCTNFERKLRALKSCAYRRQCFFTATRSFQTTDEFFGLFDRQFQLMDLIEGSIASLRKIVNGPQTPFWVF